MGTGLHRYATRIVTADRDEQARIREIRDRIKRSESISELVDELPTPKDEDRLAVFYQREINSHKDEIQRRKRAIGVLQGLLNEL